MSQGPYGPGPAAATSWAGPPPPSRLPTIIAVVIAVIAVAVAVGAWFLLESRPETPAAKTYSDHEINDAKKAVCDAFNKTEQALNTNSQRAGTAPADDRAAVANTRIAIHAAGTFLTLVLDHNPAAPEDLAQPVHDLAAQYQAMVLDQIGDADSNQLSEDYQRADSRVSQVKKACS